MAAIPAFGAIANPPLAIPKAIDLPPNPYSAATETLFHNAYNQCLLREGEATVGAQQRIWARVLGFFILEAPTDDGRCFLAQEIVHCDADGERMDLLAELYVDNLLRLFQSNKGATPAPSPPSFEGDKPFFATAIEPAPKDHKSAKKAALHRDGYRCIVTNDIDLAAYVQMNDAEKLLNDLPHGVTLFHKGIYTTFCHIFPPSTNGDLDPQDTVHRKTSYSGNVFSILKGFGGIDVLQELDGNKVHGLGNGLTLCNDARIPFDNLQLWFEECAGPPNSYSVVTVPRERQSRVVTLATATNHPLPDPRYLRLHAAVCRVAHMSGAAEYLESCDRKLETMVVLAQDGTSADVLSHRLKASSLMA